MAGSSRRAARKAPGLDERAPAFGVLVEPELGEHLAGPRAPLCGIGLPLGQEHAPELLEARRRLEDLLDDELRRHRAVPAVGGEPEGDVVLPGSSVAVESAAAAEGDRSGARACCRDREPQMLPVTDGSEIRKLGTDGEQRDVRVSEAERRQTLQLLAELERQLAAADHRVDRRHRPEILEGEHAAGMLGEGLGERVDVPGRDREPRGGAMAAPPSQQVRAGGERAVQVEGGDGAARADPVLIRVPAGDQHDRTAEALDEP